jgi:transposase
MSGTAEAQWVKRNTVLRGRPKKRLGRSRRLAKDFEASIRSATAWLYLAAIRCVVRKLAKLNPCP